LEIINAYRELGSYRAAAELCGTTHKTVRRIVERQQGAARPERPRRARNSDVVAALIVERVERTQARISAKRLLPAARAAGYEGSDRSFRRAVAEAKVHDPWAGRRQAHRRITRLLGRVAHPLTGLARGREGGRLTASLSLLGPSCWAASGGSG
jgi:hypothetical protein